MSTRLLTTVEASDHLLEKLGIRRSPKTLCKLRTIGNGPKYRQFGRSVLYHPDDLAAWVENTLTGPRGSTSEAA